ncbi:cupredoxin domain-containing protein [Spongiibacter sp. KMU-158]|uniref:Cupredoxin domain-containing protein n=1 Tax=Spongiibacter pelagi TaxID=2760804 RepID=A0A927C4I7_9GAMM|nr:cupredoxin domain-containing protein [Spongiibacter pelagi]MBD2859867.1 cupredoxin domain-containing protein [Spongiibacter pelagi]
MMIINLLGLGLIALIIWWFWLYKAQEIKMEDNELLITVENGVYSPSRIKLPVGTSIELTFLRKDPSPCAEMLLIPELQISESLPLNKVKRIPLPALKPGDYAFHCQMQMYKGQISAA